MKYDECLKCKKFFDCRTKGEKSLCLQFEPMKDEKDDSIHGKNKQQAERGKI